MAKAKRNLNTLLEPLPAPKSELIIQELVEENPLFKKPMLIEKNSALVNRRVPHSPKSIALSALHKIPNSSTILSGPYNVVHRKNESDNTSGTIYIRRKDKPSEKK